MKKLMIAAAVVCAAALSQAAQVDWELGVKQSIKTASGGDALGMNLYLVTTKNATAYATLLADLAKGDVTADNIAQQSAVYLGSGTTTTATKNPGKMSKVSTPATPVNPLLTAGGAYEVVFIAFDKKGGQDYYYVSGAKDATAWDNSTEYTQTLATVASWNDGNYSADNWKAVQSVPEPTSAMLLLLGVAGLALKRKRA